MHFKNIFSHDNFSFSDALFTGKRFLDITFVRIIPVFLGLVWLNCCVAFLFLQDVSCLTITVASLMVMECRALVKSIICLIDLDLFDFRSRRLNLNIEFCCDRFGIFLFNFF